MRSVRTGVLCLCIYLVLLSGETFSEDGDTVVNRTLDCMKARKDCEDDIYCGLAMYKVFKNTACSKSLGYDIRSGQITGPADRVCPSECGIAIYNLTSLAKGTRLQSCECINRDSICLTLKARMAKCMDTVVNGVRNQTKPSCSKIREQCSSNQQCKSAQNYFLRKCSRLISGVECSKDCKKAQRILLSMPLGRGLDECECDGYEEPHCRGIRAHQKALCFGVRVTKSITPKDRPTEFVNAAKSSNIQHKHNFTPSMWLTVCIVLLNFHRDFL